MNVFKHLPNFHKFTPLSRSEAVEYFGLAESNYFQQVFPWDPLHVAREPVLNHLYPPTQYGAYSKFNKYLKHRAIFDKSRKLRKITKSSMMVVVVLFIIALIAYKQ